MLKRIFAVLVTLTLIVVAGFIAMQREDISINALQQSYAYPDSQYVALVDLDIDLHYRDLGPTDKPTLTLIHGFSSSTHTWEKWIDSLSEEYRVLAIDLPGHGLTAGPKNVDLVDIRFYVDVLDTFFDTLDVDSTTLIGSSMGGNVSWSYAVTHPNRVDGLVLVGAAGVPASKEDQKKQPFIFRLIRNKHAANLLKGTDMTFFIQNALKKSFHDTSYVTKEMVERYVDLSRGEGHRAILLAMQNASREAFDYKDLTTFNKPSLVIHGTEDNLIPVEHGRILHETLPNSELHIFEEVGHLPHEEVAEESLEVLTRFLAQLPPKPKLAQETTLQEGDTSAGENVEEKTE